MALSFSLVDGVSFCAEASDILEAAWSPPVIRYAPEYVSWQMGFPSSATMPAAAAFDGGKPVGFMAATARHLGCRGQAMEAAVVSFVAVLPGWRGQGIAGGLYRLLLDSIAERNLPVITYSIPGSGGERALLRAYSAAGFRMVGLGSYSNYAFAPRCQAADVEWRACFCDDARVLADVAAGYVPDESALWSVPTLAQAEHYFRDPRPRRLILAECAGSGVRGAALVVLSELRTAQGLVKITTLDSVLLPQQAISALHAVLNLASTAWPGAGVAAGIVSCPNLSGFDPLALRSIGVRKTGGQFSGHFCTRQPEAFPASGRTNLEIV
ncbi:MAG TPA: GNAT family N-acetyltransferase [Bryobacteraceae bacterium]|nr:GNAT family N-acetyltransferase [Bryobacteraceae bacterium]